MREKILEICNSIGLDCVGFTSADVYNRTSDDNYKTAIVALFPYYCGEFSGANLSKYTFGKDYHKVAMEKLKFIADSSGICDYKAFSDIGPEIDRTLALNSGLCFKGLNQMCINHKYGSYFFIGYIVCNIDVEFDSPCIEECAKCGKCISSCPGGALADGFCEERCLSHITQKKGELTLAEIELIAKNKMAFGCDVCQDVCPHNKNIPITPIEEFKESVLHTLSLSDIQSLSNKEFKEKYGDRAFSWRGKQVIKRNLEIIK